MRRARACGTALRWCIDRAWKPGHQLKSIAADFADGALSNRAPSRGHVSSVWGAPRAGGDGLSGCWALPPTHRQTGGPSAPRAAQRNLSYAVEDSCFAYSSIDGDSCVPDAPHDGAASVYAIEVITGDFRGAGTTDEVTPRQARTCTRARINCAIIHLAYDYSSRLAGARALRLAHAAPRSRMLWRR